MAKKKSASVQRGQVKLREKKLKDGSSSEKSSIYNET